MEWFCREPGRLTLQLLPGMKVGMDFAETIILGEQSYERALEEQRARAASGASGLLLFWCPPTITVGRRGLAERDVLVGPSELSRLGVQVTTVDRGGLVTYHGPGQVVGFPFGALERLTGDSRGVRKLVVGLKARLEAFLDAELEAAGDARRVDEATKADEAGVWLNDAGVRRKIVALGLGFGREGVRHGFAMNLQPSATGGFELINPCGEPGARPAALFSAERSMTDFSSAVKRLSDFLESRPQA